MTKFSKKNSSNPIKKENESKVRKSSRTFRKKKKLASSAVEITNELTSYETFVNTTLHQSKNEWRDHLDELLSNIKIALENNDSLLALENAKKGYALASSTITQLENKLDWVQFEERADWYSFRVSVLTPLVLAGISLPEEINSTLLEDINFLLNDLTISYQLYQDAITWYEKNPAEEIDCSFKVEIIEVLYQQLTLLNKFLEYFLLNKHFKKFIICADLFDNKILAVKDLDSQSKSRIDFYSISLLIKKAAYLMLQENLAQALEQLSDAKELLVDAITYANQHEAEELEQLNALEIECKKQLLEIETIISKAVQEEVLEINEQMDSSVDEESDNLIELDSQASSSAISPKSTQKSSQHGYTIKKPSPYIYRTLELLKHLSRNDSQQSIVKYYLIKCSVPTLTRHLHALNELKYLSKKSNVSVKEIEFYKFDADETNVYEISQNENVDLFDIFFRNRLDFLENYLNYLKHPAFISIEHMQEEFNLTCQQLKEKTLTLGEITEHETRAQNETIVAESSGIQDQGYEEIFIESPTTSPVPTQALTVSDENEIDWDNEDTEYWNRLNNQPAQINNLLTTPSPYQRFNLFQGGGLVFSNNPSSSNTNKNIPK